MPYFVSSKCNVQRLICAVYLIVNIVMLLHVTKTYYIRIFLLDLNHLAFRTLSATCILHYILSTKPSKMLTGFKVLFLSFLVAYEAT